MSSSLRKQNTSDIDSVSSSNSVPRILDAALALITKRGDANVTMAHIAKAAGVSRQAVYLHFADRADLMVALVRHLDAKLGLEQEIERIATAPTGKAMVELMMEMQARRNPALWATARAVDAVRRTDKAAERSWQDRMNSRLQGCRQIVGRLSAERKLRTGLAEEDAADLLWSLTSLHTWEDLVLQREWGAKRYQEHITRVVLDALTGRRR